MTRLLINMANFNGLCYNIDGIGDKIVG